MNKFYLIVPESLYLTELSDKQIVVLAKLYQMQKALEQVYPSSAYLGKLFDLTARQVRTIISTLNQLDYIKVNIKKSNKRFIKLKQKALIHFEENDIPQPQKKEVLKDFYKIWEN